MFAVACFLPARAKDLSAPPRIVYSAGYTQETSHEQDFGTDYCTAGVTPTRAKLYLLK